MRAITLKRRPDASESTGALGIVSETLRPLIGPAYLLYGLLLPAWFVMVGVKLFSLRTQGP